MTGGVATNRLFAHDSERFAPRPLAEDGFCGFTAVMRLPVDPPLEVCGAISPTI
jgi:hypothetical protein